MPAYDDGLFAAGALMAGFDKGTLRAEGLARRGSIDAAVAATFATRLARLGPELARAQEATTVAAFSSIGDEVATGPLLHALDEAGFIVCLPVTGRRGARLVFRRWAPDAAMVAGRMGIREPSPACAIVEPDLLFVPLAAFDRRGHRIGYGAGFYDQTLAALRAAGPIAAIGVAYAAQEVLFVPNEPHDQPLDLIVTEVETIACAEAA